jgi:hypothetical protein
VGGVAGQQDSDSGALFAERAAATMPDFEVTAKTAAP